MFDDDDPYLERVRKLCAGFPEADEKISHGRPAFFTKKVFVYYGGSHKNGDEWTEFPYAVMVQPDPGDRAALLEDTRTFVPAYLGPSGWIGIVLDDKTDWSEITELFDASFRLTASKRAITALDARTP